MLAVVDGALVTQSDVAVAVRLGLVPGAAAPDPVSAALDALIERRLMLAEVDRYAPPPPPEAGVDRHVADIRARAGAQFDTILLQGGISVDELRRRVREICASTPTCSSDSARCNPPKRESCSTTAITAAFRRTVRPSVQ